MKERTSSLQRAYSLIGVLAAMVLLGTVFFTLFRFNHHIEAKFYTPPESENRLRALAWEQVMGSNKTENPPTVKKFTDSGKDNPQNFNREPLTIDGISCLKLTNGNSHYYVIQAPQAPGSNN